MIIVIVVFILCRSVLTINNFLHVIGVSIHNVNCLLYIQILYYNQNLYL